MAPLGGCVEVLAWGRLILSRGRHVSVGADAFPRCWISGLRLVVIRPQTFGFFIEPLQPCPVLLSKPASRVPPNSSNTTAKMISNSGTSILKDERSHDSSSSVTGASESVSQLSCLARQHCDPAPDIACLYN